MSSGDGSPPADTTPGGDQPAGATAEAAAGATPPEDVPDAVPEASPTDTGPPPDTGTGADTGPGPHAGSVGAAAPRAGRGWRDRHGRGIRGPLVPASLPLARTRGDTFDEVVLDAAGRLRGHLPDGTDELQFSVEDIPPPAVTDALFPGEPVPLGSAIPADSGRPARVVVYRRTIELRAGSGPDTAELVYEVVLEQAAELLGVPPEEIDPDFGEDDT